MTTEEITTRAKSAHQKMEEGVLTVSTLTTGSQECKTPSNEEFSLEDSLFSRDEAFHHAPLSKRFMTEEDSSLNDDNASAPPGMRRIRRRRMIWRRRLMSPEDSFSSEDVRHFHAPRSKRFMTEEDSSSDDDNASAPPGPPPRRPTPLSNTNTNSLLQTSGGASMQNVGGALLYHDGDGADCGGADKEVSTTSYASAPEEYVENYGLDSGDEDTECDEFTECYSDDVETIDGFEESQDATVGAPGYELLCGRERAESPVAWGADKRRKTEETTTSSG